MKDDYLWDRSGQPDPDVQQLEEILGELRYQPRELEIPAELKTAGHRFYLPRYAIAAAVAMIVLGVGVWVAMQKQTTPVAAVPQTPPTQVKIETPESPKQTVAVAPIEEDKVITPRRIRVKPQRSRTTRSPQLSSEEMAEAIAAKDRLMMALRLASSKLNYAQKKTQSSSPAPVYHQHKIG